MPASTPSATAHAVLGLLSVRDWTTYELAKQLERSLQWFWPRTERKIYDEAKRLVARGHASASSDPVGRRPRTIYSITDAGRETLRQWLAAPSAPPKFESEAVVRTFFADAASLDDLRRTLVGAARAADERRAVLESMVIAASDPAYEFGERMHINALALRLAIDQERLFAEWAQWALAQTDGWASTTDPLAWDWRGALG